MASGLLQSLLAALQAAASVLLTIVYGVLAGQYGILDLHSTRQISRLCVSILMPALLFTKVGSELDNTNITRYAAIVVWSLTYTFTSIAMAIGLKRALNLPSWTIVATAFNNTTALPLLLVETLAATGILETLLSSETDTVGAAVSRAQSYFLVNSLCGNVATFTIGPMLLDGRRDRSENDQDQNDATDSGQANGNEPDELTSLLPAPVAERSATAESRLQARGSELYESLPWPLQRAADFLAAFNNPPFIGGALGVLIGLVPPLQRAFFNNVQDGGFFNAWLTTSIENIGGLFAALQIVAVGVKLSACLRKMVRGEESGQMPWRGLFSILTFRFILWPAISIPVIYVVCSKSQILSDDPILWFVLMLMPCGPSAMNLTSLTDVSGSEEEEQLGLTKFLTISYSVSPLLAFPVAGALRASRALIRKS